MEDEDAADNNRSEMSNEIVASGDEEVVESGDVVVDDFEEAFYVNNGSREVEERIMASFGEVEDVEIGERVVREEAPRGDGVPGKPGEVARKTDGAEIKLPKPKEDDESKVGKATRRVGKARRTYKRKKK